MKRLIISVIMAALALFVAVFSYFDVSKNADVMTALLEEAASDFENGDIGSGAVKCGKAAEVWDSCRGRLEMYLCSEELFEIDTGFAQIKKLLGEGNAEELIKVCFENINSIKRMAENQTPSLKKIF